MTTLGVIKVVGAAMTLGGALMTGGANVVETVKANQEPKPETQNEESK